MKKIILALAITTILISCSGTRSISKREIISPGAPLNMPFRSDETTLRAYAEFTDTNPLDAYNRNLAYCKALISAAAFNGIEDACMVYTKDYDLKKKFIEHMSDRIIKACINDAKVVYTKTTTDGTSYTSRMLVELKKEKMLEQLKDLFIENGVTDTEDAGALFAAINDAIHRNTPDTAKAYQPE